MPKEKPVQNKKESFRFTPMDFLSKRSHIEIEDNKTVILEGSKGVLEYSTECIRVSVDGYIISFQGRNLTLKCISPTALTICGYILNVNFSD